MLETRKYKRGNVLIVMIILLVGVIWLVSWKTYGHPTDPTAAKTKIASSNNVYTVPKPPAKPTAPAGWKTYCNGPGGLCLIYPASWQINTIGSGEAPDPSMPGVTILSLASGTNVAYLPDMPAPPLSNNVCGSICLFTTLSATDDPNFPNTKIIEGVFQAEGFANPEYCLMSDDLVSGFGLKVGSTVNIGTFFGCQFKNTKAGWNIGLGLSLVVDSDNFADAKDWLSSPDGKIAKQIIQSAQPN